MIVYFIKKSSSSNNSAIEEPVKHQISFDNLSEEEQSARNETFNSIMQSSHSEELTKCYNKIKSLFIPKKNGEFSGSISGLLSEKSRAKTLANTNETVAHILGNNTQEYAVWYNVLFDNILNEMYFSPNGKLAQFSQLVIADVQKGNALLEQIGIVDILSDPETANSSTKIRTDDATIKIEKRLRITSFIMK